MTQAPPPLTEAERTVLAGLAEVLVPAWKNMPSAGDVALAGAPIDAALQSRPDLAPSLRRLLAECAGVDPLRAVERLSQERPAEFSLLLQAVAGAYYMHPRVRQALGYGGQRRLEPSSSPSSPP